MASRGRQGSSGSRGWVRWTGLAAVAGSVVWTTAPWLQVATLGTRPYAATAFDPVSLLAWVLMAGGLYGLAVVFRQRFGLHGRIGLPVAAVGMVLVAGLSTYSTAQFVASGFTPVPASGENPLVLILAYGGYGFTFLGTGLLGIALWWLPEGPTVIAAMLVLAALAPIFFLAVLLERLPEAVRVVVSVNAPLIPLGIAWIALGYFVYSTDVGGSDPDAA